nr:PREDICTED: uncharacterized protein LOC109040032 [Bemisia tabaci]
MHKIQLHLTQLVMEFLGVSCFASPKYGTSPPEPSSEAIKDALIKHEIYKDLGYVNYPKHLLQVNFAEHHLQLGTRVPPDLALMPPDGINYTHYEKRGYYALLTDLIFRQEKILEKEPTGIGPSVIYLSIEFFQQRV